MLLQPPKLPHLHHHFRAVVESKVAPQPSVSASDYDALVLTGGVMNPDFLRHRRSFPEPGAGFL